MKVDRRFTRAGQDVFSAVTWTKRDSKITNADGSLVFEMKDAEVPEGWSQLATDIMVSKYFRKAGVPQYNADGSPVVDREGQIVTGPERGAMQVIHRLAGCWTQWGREYNYFDTDADAQTFYDELCHMMVHQYTAPNSPQWFNTGLHWAYGISGPPQGHWITDPSNGRQHLADDAYTHPQPHACFIQSVGDDLVNEGGIMDLWVREARLFKYGSGTGTNFSHIRGENEPLSGGGKSSGLMSFLKIGDRAAGAIKSGGTTRRAAKMVCLDADHPDIEQFVNWKVREEVKVAALVEGIRHLGLDEQAVAEKLGITLDYDFNGEAYATVSGQNSNNSVRLTDRFFKAVERDEAWELTSRTDGAVVRTIRARELWDQICYAAWRCADPGLQYDTTINAWHTCPESGRINASNPCSEYMFLDNTACNLASLNLLKFYNTENRTLDTEGLEHAVMLWTIVLEISVLMAAFPSEEIARQSFRFRTLGLGFANLGALLMQAGIPYDSEEGRAICGAISSIMTGRSYATSALMARQFGPFDAYEENADAMLRVIRNHRRAARGVARDAEAYESLDIRPVPIDHELLLNGESRIANASQLLDRAAGVWDDALHWGRQWGFRNAQVSVIAPTGTIGLLMDCDTTGVEPDYALVKFKKLAGGGYFKIANDSLRPALATLGYNEEQTDDIVRYVMGTLSLDTPMPEDSDGAGKTFRAFLEEQGYGSDDLVQLENELPTVFELTQAFNAWNMPEHVLSELGITADAARNDPEFNGLRTLGLPASAVEDLDRLICGTQTIEGAPHLNARHLPVFDCANTCGKTGKRFIATEGHIRMMAAAQPFISGAISKTINLPNHADLNDIASAYWLSWEMGLKANALYRDGSKLSQPLNSRTDADLEEEDDDDALADALEEVSEEVAEAAEVIAAESNGEVEPQYVERIVERIIERPMRRRLPDTRQSVTHRFNVAGHEGYLTVGLYEESTPGELFITMSKEGSTIGGLMDSLGTAISVALQYGVPIESLVTKFAAAFEPMGMTTNRDIPFAKSLVDYIFRWLGMEFVPGYREANAPQRSSEEKPAVKSASSSSRQAVTEDARWSKEASGEDGGRMRETGASNVPDRPEVTPGSPIPGAPPDAGKIGGPRKPGPVQTMAGTVVPGSSSPATATARSAMSEVPAIGHALDSSLVSMQSDAPACDVCGAITVCSGTCYKCLNCGNSKGCS